MRDKKVHQGTIEEILAPFRTLYEGEGQFFVDGSVALLKIALPAIIGMRDRSAIKLDDSELLERLEIDSLRSLVNKAKSPNELIISYLNEFDSKAGGEEAKRIHRAFVFRIKQVLNKLHESEIS